MLQTVAILLLGNTLLLRFVGIAVVLFVLAPKPDDPIKSATSTDCVQYFTPSKVRAYLVREGSVTACLSQFRWPMHVDPMAPMVVLTWDQAAELNLKPSRLQFDQSVDLDGVPREAARITVATIIVGDIEVRDVDALVARDKDLRGGIIGQSFLNRLKAVKVNPNGELVLIPST